jgi:hypothetical protein
MNRMNRNDVAESRKLACSGMSPGRTRPLCRRCMGERAHKWLACPFRNSRFVFLSVSYLFLLFLPSCFLIRFLLTIVINLFQSEGGGVRLLNVNIVSFFYYLFNCYMFRSYNHLLEDGHMTETITILTLRRRKPLTLISHTQ